MSARSSIAGHDIRPGMVLRHPGVQPFLIDRIDHTGRLPGSVGVARGVDTVGIEIIADTKYEIAFEDPADRSEHER